MTRIVAPSSKKAMVSGNQAEITTAQAPEPSLESGDAPTSLGALSDQAPAAPPPVPERFVLDVPHGMAWYAEMHGAVFDPERNSWVVAGELPPELINLLPQVQATRSQRLPNPFCPKCGCHMRKMRGRRTGIEFWGCSAYRRSGCSGTMSLEEHLDRAERDVAPTIIGVLARPTALRDATGDPKEVKAESSSVTPMNLEKSIREIVESACAALGSDVVGWFDRPSVGLGHTTPTQLLRTQAGRERLLKYLLDLRKYG